MPSISYCISVCNEHLELANLLMQLIPNLDQEDELIILLDKSKATSEVREAVRHFKDKYLIIQIECELAGDFATFKNTFIEASTKEYIFQIDADELLSEENFTDLKLFLEYNPQIDLFWIARENYVEGITQTHLEQWGWKIDNKNRINYSDPQGRLFKNNKRIHWKNKVHEVLHGYHTSASLPKHCFIIHRKTIKKQELQNNFYDSI